MKGYVYALVNPSLPNMVKVGQTTRNPEDRARELSAATGIPTPFFVGYSIAVSHCVNAERQAHEMLTQKGIRIASNREFFNAPLQEIVRVLNELEYLFQIDDTNDETGLEKGLEVGEIIYQLLREGFSYEHGTDDVFEDHYIAENKYLAAVRLGSNEAKLAVGKLYAKKYNDVYNPKKAESFLIDAYESGADTFICLWALAELYVSLDKTNNAELAYKKLFKDKKLIDDLKNACLLFLDEGEYLKIKNVQEKMFYGYKMDECLYLFRHFTDMMMAYFGYLSKGKVSPIASPLVFLFIPLIQFFAKYFDHNPSLYEPYVAGFNKYLTSLSQEIINWKNIQGKNEIALIERLCNELRTSKKLSPNGGWLDF